MTDEQFDELQRHYIELIEELRRQYEKAAAPYVKRLVELEAIRPRRYVITNQELSRIFLELETKPDHQEEVSR